MLERRLGLQRLAEPAVLAPAQRYLAGSARFCTPPVAQCMQMLAKAACTQQERLPFEQQADQRRRDQRRGRSLTQESGGAQPALASQARDRLVQHGADGAGEVGQGQPGPG
jgi:hypothetical protein